MKLCVRLSKRTNEETNEQMSKMLLIRPCSLNETSSDSELDAFQLLFYSTHLRLRSLKMRCERQMHTLQIFFINKTIQNDNPINRPKVTKKLSRKTQIWKEHKWKPQNSGDLQKLLLCLLPCGTTGGIGFWSVYRGHMTLWKVARKPFINNRDERGSYLITLC